MRLPGSRIRVVTLVVFVLAVAFALAACGGDDDATVPAEPPAEAAPEPAPESVPEPAPTPTPAPEPGPMPESDSEGGTELAEGPIEAGTYQTRVFRPAASFSIGEGWILEVERSHVLGLVLPGAEAFLSVIEPQGSFPADEGVSAESIEPVPEDPVAWVLDHPLLITTEPETFDSGGRTVVQFMIEVNKDALRAALENLTGEAVDVLPPESNVALFEANGGPYVLPTGVAAQVTAFDLGDGERTIFVFVEAPADEIEEAIETATVVVQSLEFASVPETATETNGDHAAGNVSPITALENPKPPRLARA